MEDQGEQERQGAATSSGAASLPGVQAIAHEVRERCAEARRAQCDRENLIANTIRHSWSETFYAARTKLQRTNHIKGRQILVVVTTSPSEREPFVFIEASDIEEVFDFGIKLIKDLDAEPFCYAVTSQRADNLLRQKPMFVWHAKPSGSSPNLHVNQFAGALANKRLLGPFCIVHPSLADFTCEHERHTHVHALIQIALAKGFN
ncbi:Hypothetical Protein FCC1311_106252 [Hondaea fermentalgiana]|uniref:Uncharacterized protein n=1 Tax=Hondaea fermentalgiana TaxID=2315210 RepID=A0A2R5H0V4_9STRA|nr:Hypothetical Protein FCC1311_106252 [Hondaea fermentalgiana]|eukprot:GBG34401.1 Hypothetical Protein FCC1311_106252 [Hondaea fermentalgiana]